MRNKEAGLDEADGAHEPKGRKTLRFEETNRDMVEEWYSGEIKPTEPRSVRIDGWIARVEVIRDARFHR